MKKFEVYFEKIKALFKSKQPMIIEIEYKFDITNRRLAGRLVKLFILDLNGTPKESAPIFLGELLCISGVSACQYLGHGDILVIKEDNYRWDYLMPKIRETISDGLCKKVTH